MAIDINVPSQIKNYANLAGFPVTGTLKTIFIAEDTNKTYRWTGSSYVEISASQAASWGTITGTLSTQTDLQTALNAKEPTIASGTTGQYYRGDKTFQALDKTAVGLPNADNTSDLNKPISTATQTALNAKVTGNTAITGATKTKVTFDSKGLVTSGADATTADIADSLNKRYVTDANLTTIGNQSGVNTGDQTLSGLGGVPTTRTLTINGTTQDLSANRTFTVSTGITIGTTAITSGVVGRVLFEGAGNVVQESANLFWDNVNGRLGIGTSTPTDKLDITQMGYGFISLNRTGVASAAFLITNIRTGGGPGLVIDTGSFSFRNGTSKNLILDGGRIGVNTNDDSLNASFTVKGAGATSTTKNILFKNSLNTDLFTIWDDGAVGVNTSTNAGFKVDVNGTARVSGNVSVLNGVIGIDTNVNIGVIEAPGQFNFGVDKNNGYAWIQSYGSRPIALNPIGNSVMIGITNIVTSAILNVASTTQGFLPPRMTSTQKNAIASPATGLMVYDTTLNLIALYNGTIWTTL